MVRRAVGVMLWKGVWVSGPSLGARVQHNQQPCWLCPGKAGSTVGVGAACHGGYTLIPLHGDPPPTHTPSPPPTPSQTLFPIQVSRCHHLLFRWETSSSSPSVLHKNTTTKKKTPNQERREINKQSLPSAGLASAHSPSIIN